VSTFTLHDKLEAQMESAVNSLFSPIMPGKQNAEILAEALEVEKLREEVVDRLSQIEAQDQGHFWWQDHKLMDIFRTVYESGCILLPIDPVERLRWIALLCVDMSSIEGFSCGNLVLPVDFLPDDMMVLFEEVYSVGVMEEVEKIRKQLAEGGWKSIFPDW